MHARNLCFPLAPFLVPVLVCAQAPSSDKASTHNVLWADQFPGADLGASVNAAIAQRHGTCGAVAIAPGTYTFATQIVKPRCITLEGNNAVLTWAGAAETPAITTGSIAGVDYTFGGMRDLKLVGNGTGTGIYLGRRAAGYVAQADVDDYLELFQNVTVSGFRDNWVKGPHTYQITVVGGASTSAVHANWLDLGFGSENMIFFGWQSLNSRGYGFYSDALDGAQYNFVACSFDYNTSGAFFYINGTVRLNNYHIEQGNDAPFFDSPASPTAFSLQLSGGGQFVTASPSLPAFVRVRGTNSFVFIDKGLNLSHPNGPVRQIVDWQSAGQSNQLNIEPYADPLATRGVSAKPVNDGANLQWVTVPAYGQYVPTNRYISAETAGTLTANAGPAAPVGVVGTKVNMNGRLPGPNFFPQGGAFSLWNMGPRAVGEADWINPFYGGSNETDGHTFWVVNHGAYTRVGGFTRDGHVSAPNGYAGGWSGTCPSGHALIVSNGVVTGCN